MKSVSKLALLACILLGLLAPGDVSAEGSDATDFRLAVPGPGNLLKSTGTGGSAKAATDTFYIYGGPGTLEGQFQTEASGFGGSPDPQGWFGVDFTELVPFWHASTILAESVADGNPQGFSGGLSNYAAISHHEGNDYTGYGNNWDDWLVFTYDVSANNPGFNPVTDSTTVRFALEYKYFVEDGYDYVHFEWNRGGAYQLLVMVDGNSYNDTTGYYEAVDFDSDDLGPIVYQPGDYIGGTSIELRVRVSSDGGWSDEDGLFTSDGLGAAALDNITVHVDGAIVSTANFEPLSSKVDLPEGDFTDHDVGAGAGTYGWTSTPSNFAGDFSKLFANVQDIDVCRSNESFVWSFINDGTSPNNCPSCPIAPAISGLWSYGIPGGYVVDYNGGLTNGVASLINEIWSPEIEWDLPGTEDDVANGGAVLGFSRYTHLPALNGMLAVWRVRSFDGTDWTAWKKNTSGYYSNVASWGNYQIDVTKFMVSDPERVQIALGVVDLADLFGFPGDDATIAPLYDNVYFKKYVIGGPVISTRTIDLASDCFPVDGTLTGSCRFDANIDRNYSFLVPGDSIVAEIKAIIPGTSLADPIHGGDLVVVHLTNPDFADERAAGLAQVGASWLKKDLQTWWDVYYYRVPGQSVTTSSGNPVADRYFWDLPDGTSNGLPHIQEEAGLFFPGDVIHFYLEADDDQGNRSTLPEDITGFDNFTYGTPFSRVYTVRALPTLQGGSQPSILYWNDAGHGESEQRFLNALGCNNLMEGRDHDTYTTKGASSGLGNGLGSAGFHGASAEQLAGYDMLIYGCGSLGSYTISDGTGRTNNDLGADVATLSAWANADADRYHAYFGDDFAESMVAQGGVCRSYLNNELGVDFLAADVGPQIDNQTAAVVEPTGMGSDAYYFRNSYVAYGGCLVINDFDEIGAFGVGPVLAHEFTQPTGIQYWPSVAGSIEWLRSDGDGNTKHSIVFPYDLGFVEDDLSDPYSSAPAWRALMSDLLSSWGYSWASCDPFPCPPLAGAICGPTSVDDPPDTEPLYRFGVGQNHPNPFNPVTTISYELRAREHVSVRVYNLRGELVATLQDGILDAGPHSVVWRGRDSRDSDVASGVYLYTVSTADQTETRKMALIR